MKSTILTGVICHLLIFQLSAQIQVIGINETITTPHAPVVDEKTFDINEDSVDDLSIAGTRTDSMGVRSILMYVYAGTRVQAFGTANFIMRYFVGDEMDSASYIPTNDSAIFYFTGDIDYYTFAGGGDLYAAVSFHFEGNTHYGWMRVSVAGDGSSLTFKEVAWNENAGTKIFAGQTTGGTSAPNLAAAKNQVLVYNLGNGHVRLANLNGYRSYRLFSGDGALVATGPVNNQSLQITRPPGIYILHLQGPDELLQLKIPLR